MDEKATTFALCIYLDPDAPHALEQGGTGQVARLANYQWLRVDGRGSVKSSWQGAGDDPQMRGGKDYLAVYVVDMSGEMPAEPTFVPTWRHRFGAGAWEKGDQPPYSSPPLTPRAEKVEDPPGLAGTFNTWFFAPTLLASPGDRPVTYSLTGAAIGVGPDQTYWVDPEMEIEP